ncbi:MAG: hypothetical protein Kow0042_30230 [Calditrichia bacterium]
MKSLQENFQRIIDFQKVKSRELKRQITFSEAVALWFSQIPSSPDKKNNKKKDWITESTIY